MSDYYRTASRSAHLAYSVALSWLRGHRYYYCHDVCFWGHTSFESVTRRTDPAFGFLLLPVSAGRLDGDDGTKAASSTRRWVLSAVKVRTHRIRPAVMQLVDGSHGGYSEDSLGYMAAPASASSHLHLHLRAAQPAVHVKWSTCPIAAPSDPVIRVLACKKTCRILLRVLRIIGPLDPYCGPKLQETGKAMADRSSLESFSVPSRPLAVVPQLQTAATLLRYPFCPTPAHQQAHLASASRSRTSSAFFLCPRWRSWLHFSRHAWTRLAAKRQPFVLLIVPRCRLGSELHGRAHA